MNLDRFPNPLRREDAFRIGKEIFGFDGRGLQVLEIFLTKDLGTGMFYNQAFAGAEKATFAAELKHIVFPELNQAVIIGYDANQHILVYVSDIQEFSVVTPQR